MKIIRNKYLPFHGFKAINLFGIVFTHGNLYDYDINHEAIHTAQMKEMLYIFFYIWYAIEYLIKLFKHRDTSLAYKNISFEREAYYNMDDFNYIKNKSFWAFTKHLK